MIKKLRETFRPESSYKAFFITIVTFALAHGLYKGIIDNYLAEAVGMSAFDKGVSEFFREMPGLALIFVLALLYEFSAERIYQIGALVMLSGMAMQSISSSACAIPSRWNTLRRGRAELRSEDRVQSIR